MKILWVAFLCLKLYRTSRIQKLALVQCPQLSASTHLNAISMKKCKLLSVLLIIWTTHRGAQDSDCDSQDLAVVWSHLSWPNSHGLWLLQGTSKMQSQWTLISPKMQSQWTLISPHHLSTSPICWYQTETVTFHFHRIRLFITSLHSIWVLHRTRSYQGACRLAT